MFCNKVFIFLFIVQKVLTAPDYYDYTREWFDLPESVEVDDDDTKTGIIYLDDTSCPEKDQSSISNSDLKYFMEDIATKLELEEYIANSYYAQAVEIRYKYLEELDNFKEQVEDRPKHMLHILEDIAKFREKLDPEVQKIAAILQDFDIYHVKHNNVAEAADTLLKQVDKYRKICQINCEDFEIETRFGHKNIYNSLILKDVINKNRTCIKIKDLEQYIITKLSHFQEEYSQALLCEIDERDEMYYRKLNDFKINLKDAAVKQFGMTMYDILSLQDDYHHFEQELKNIDVVSELDNIQENTAEIKYKLVSLKRDVEEYRQYCMNCNSDRRTKRNINPQYWGMQREQYSDNSYDVIDYLLKSKIDEIKGIIESNFTAIFEDLDEDFDDMVIDSYVKKLEPIQEDIKYYIQMEQEALEELQRSVPESLIEEIMELSQASAEMVQALDSAKQYIDRFI